MQLVVCWDTSTPLFLLKFLIKTDYQHIRLLIKDSLSLRKRGLFLSFKVFKGTKVHTEEYN